jgi:hypothetical protein
VRAGVYRGKPIAVIPWIPATFSMLYQYDMFYCNNIERIRQMSAELLKNEPELFQIQKGITLITQEKYADLFITPRKSETKK